MSFDTKQPLTLNVKNDINSGSIPDTESIDEMLILSGKAMQ